MTGGDLMLVLLAVAAGSFLKSVVGMGLPAIAVPVMSFFIGIEAAVVVVALPNFALNVALAWTERSSLARTRDLPVLAVGSLLGAALGTVVFVVVSERPLVALLVLSVIGYVIVFFTQPEMAVSPAMSKRWAPAIGLIGGVFQGAIGISGPIVGSWLHSYRLDRGAHVLSLTVVFIISGTTQFVILILAGEFRGLWVAAVLACLPALATVPVGSRMRGRLSRNLFDYLVIFAIAAAGLGLGVRTFF